MFIYESQLQREKNLRGEEDLSTDTGWALPVRKFDSVVAASAWGGRVGGIGEPGCLPAPERGRPCLGTVGVDVGLRAEEGVP